MGSLQMQMLLKTNAVICSTLESLPVIIKNVQWHEGEFVLFFQGKQIHSVGRKWRLCMYSISVTDAQKLAFRGSLALKCQLCSDSMHACIIERSMLT